MDINDTVTIRIPRWTTEQVSLINLVVDRIVEIRKFSDTEFDLYSPTPHTRGLLYRVGTVHDLKTADLDLFDSDRRMFWEQHITKLDSETVKEISVIHSPNWQPSDA